MAIPNLSKIRRPALEFLAQRPERNVHIRKELVPALAERFNLTEEEKGLAHQSGATVLYHRVNWVCTGLSKAELVERTRRGYVRITREGKNYLDAHSGEIRMTDLKNHCPAYKEWTEGFGGKPNDNSQGELDGHEGTSPEERIQNAFQEINAVLKGDLLEKIMKQTPDFFERLVVKLLKAMGYGSEGTLAKATGQTGDGGIDGIIHQDVLGLGVVYLQAKRYSQDNHVGSGSMRNFIGALNERGADKGVFITTSRFSASAKDTAERVPQNIITIDGKDLVEYMVQYEVGVRIDQAIKLYKIDGDFFDE